MAHALRVRWAICVAVVAACSALSATAAQTIHGTARDESGRGSGLTTIALVDTLGAIVAGTITGDAGTYVLHAPAAGSYRVRARRIGFAPDSSPVIILANGATVTFDPAMMKLRTQLAEVRVEESRRCALAPDAGAQAVRLWQEAQNALSGAVVGSVSGTNSFALDRFQRHLDRDGRRVVSATRWQLPAQGSETYASIPADSLAKHGYVKTIGPDAIYYAPDARTLLSDAFARTHCLRPVAGLPGSDTVGLAFEPVGRDNRTEVTGTLWLARSTGKLRYLAFEYLDSASRDGSGDPRLPHATGRVEYRELPSGAWIISSWVIRAPLVHIAAAHNVATTFGAFRADATPTVIGWWEFGGDVRDVTTSQSDEPPSTAPSSGSIRGVLIDSIAGRGMSDVEAIVETSGGARINARSVTDSSGSFEFDSLSPGDYALHFAAPRLDTIGMTIAPVPFAIAAGHEVTLTITVPPSGVGRACAVMQPGQRAVHGIIRDSTSDRPLSAVSVRASWIASVSSSAHAFSARSLERAVATDSSGRYILCGLPADRVLTVTVTGAGLRPGKITIPSGTQTIVLRNLTLATGAVRVGQISGTIRDSRGKPIGAAEVTLLDDPATRVYSDSGGTFNLDHVPVGLHALSVRRLGFAPSAVQVRVPSPNASAMRVVMATSASVLTTVSVHAPSGELLNLPADAAHRVIAGQGYYVLAGDVRLRDSHATTDLFRRLQGVTVIGNRAFSTRGVNSLLADPCPLGIPLYVNGAVMADNTLDVVVPSDIVAVELYPTTASMPPSLHPSPCGAILIWTR